MSNPFETEKKVLIACSNCGTRRQKVCSDPYYAFSISMLTTTPDVAVKGLSSVPQLPEAIQEPWGHANNPHSLGIRQTSHYVVPSDVSASLVGQTAGGSMTSGSQYPPTSDGTRTWPVVPAYIVEAPGTVAPGSNRTEPYSILGMHLGTTPMSIPQDTSPGELQMRALPVTPPGLHYKTSKKKCRPTVDSLLWEKVTRNGKHRQHGGTARSTESVTTRYISKLRKEVRVAPPSVGPTKVKLGQSFNQGGFTRGETSKRPAAQLSSGNRWLGPRTQIRARSTTPIIAEGLSNSIITTSRFILTTSPHTRPRN
ncbi:hypothetical protein C8F04DRAFT_1233666 [Mycena alexandri]|uniref:Uncharacterized protein n=1 Tax=Mycena alexandri TaxID=1745969 RepID=A0AAD6SWN6_9AGAR|nr:hypothetical protein C8F04DRAFT_1233666 [Mycena alexandri]